ncbi:transposase-like protein [Bradyrhizobium sp. USDA 10063]
MEREGGHAKTKIKSGVKVEAVKLVGNRGVSVAEAARDLDVYESWMGLRCRSGSISRSVFTFGNTESSLNF